MSRPRQVALLSIAGNRVDWTPTIHPRWLPVIATSQLVINREIMTRGGRGLFCCWDNAAWMDMIICLLALSSHVLSFPSSN